jgi:hypothetical protein
MITSQKLLLFSILTLFCSEINYAQNTTEKILWDKSENIPIPYATIKSDQTFTISNEKGYFAIDFKSGKLLIQNLAYQNLEIDAAYFKNNDTIFMKSAVYELDEIVIDKNERFNKMRQTIKTDYALEPHQEKFFLRAVIKKNNEFYKIVDFSGYVEKKTLFGTSIKAASKKNYTVQIENTRKAGFEHKDFDFEFFSFNIFFEVIASIYLAPEIYNYSYETSDDDKFTKILATPKDKDKVKRLGYYFVDNADNTFNEAYIVSKSPDAEFTKIIDYKFRTIFFEVKSNFARNEKTNKHQLNLSVLKATTEVFRNNERDEFTITYIYYANPTNTEMKLKSNVNLKTDMFELRGKYDAKYWEENQILPLTVEMQEFINKVNSANEKSDFKSKSNMK